MIGIMITREMLIDVLKPHRQEVVEADEWRPIADHIIAILRLYEIECAHEIAHFLNEEHDCRKYPIMTIT